jgi:hypothetical protein
MLDQRTATLVGRRVSSQARKPPTDNQAEGAGKKEAGGALHVRHYCERRRARQDPRSLLCGPHDEASGVGAYFVASADNREAFCRVRLQKIEC